MEVENKVEIVSIIEHYMDDSDCVGVYDYNKLPQNVKDNVDKGLSNKGGDVWNVDGCENGLQFLYHNKTEYPPIKIGTVGEFKGTVEFWEEGF